MSVVVTDRACIASPRASKRSLGWTMLWSRAADSPRLRSIAWSAGTSFVSRSPGSARSRRSSGSIPFVKSFLPSAKAKALGNPIEVDLSTMEPGTVQAHLYRGETMLVLRRTKEMLATLAATDALVLDKTPDPEYADPEYIDREHRAINPEFLVVRGVCTHLGCVPVLRGDGRQADGRRVVARRVHLPVPSIRLRLRGPRRARARTAQLAGAAASFRSPTRIVIGEEPTPT